MSLGVRLLCVAIGSALGGMARYAVGMAFSRLAMPAAWLPYATFFVNVSGAFAMGLLLGFLTREDVVSPTMRESYRLILAFGFLGGYTTFSSLAAEGWSLGVTRGVAYIGVSVITGILAFGFGLWLTRPT